MRGAGYRVSSADRRLIGLAVSAILILAIVDSASATAPGSNGKVYYQGPQSGETGPTDIFRTNPDGSEPQDLTPGSASEERPNVSADGQHVVFQSFRDEGWNIFSMNADGSGQVDLTNTEYEPDKIVNFEPTWSPDGTKVAFMRQSKFAGEEQDIWVMEANGANRVNLTHSTGVYETSPEFSPDGTKIVYVSAGTNNDIWVMNANGSGQTQLTETAPPTQNVAPTWSPDGTKIAYSVFEAPTASNDGLHVMNANGSSQTPLLNESSPILTNLLSWSPDGTEIAYKSASIGGELRLVGASGGPSTLLVENSGADYPSWAPAVAPGTPPGTVAVPPVTPISTGLSNHFSFGKLKLNKKKGTATLIVQVPGAGSLVLGGKGVKKAKANAKAPGKVPLPVVSAAKAMKKLTEFGKVKLTLTVTFTPAGGAPNTESKKVTLKKLPAP
jgi:dipeptidyl aminopeptidase/acylaminoacyl peptidase